MSRKFDAIVIGAGSNGLTAATVLARAGWQVLLLEKHDLTGGQNRMLEFAPGFRASPLGSHGGWAPPAVAKAFGLTGAAHPQAPLTVAIGPDEYLPFWRDAQRASDAIARYSRTDAAKWPSFTARLHKLAGLLGELYAHPAPAIAATEPAELLALLKHGRQLRRLGRDDMIEFLRLMPMSVQELADDWFEAGPLKAGIAASGVRAIQQGPRSGGTGFVLLHHLIGAPAGSIRNAAWWLAGRAGFLGAAQQAARQSGVTIRTAAEVSRVAVKDYAMTGVVLTDGEEISAPRVLSTCDPLRTLIGMIDAVWFDPEFLHAVRNIRFRGCTATVLYALERLPSVTMPAESLHGAVSLSSDGTLLERAADAAKYGEMSEQPQLELTVPTMSAREGELAPAGKHVMIARAQWAPYRLNGGWTAGAREQLTQRVTSGIAQVMPGFADCVAATKTFAPPDLAELYGLTEAASSCGELALDQVLFMRPVAGWSRYRMPLDGLFLAGAGAHPGPGVLGGAGWLAARAVLKAGKGR